MTNASLQEPFVHNWSAQLLSEQPLIAPARHFTLPKSVPGEEDALRRGALLVSVKPCASSSFLATCALGFRDAALPSGIWSCPCPDELLAVAGGYAYRIDTRSPETATLLEQRPVTGLLAAPAYELLLLSGFHDVLALGPTGIRWRSRRLSWEGVTLGRLEDHILHGSGWNMFTDTDVPFLIDLKTGHHEGGGYDPQGASRSPDRS